MFGRHKLPGELSPKLAKDERVLAWSRVDSGAVVATNKGLWLPGRRDRLGWHEVHKATWTPPTLTVIAGASVGKGDGYEVMADQAGVSFRLTEPGDVPLRVRERVTHSVVHTSHHELPGGGGARVVGRHVPGVDGLTWHVRFDPGTDHEDAEVSAAVAAIVAELAARAAAAADAGVDPD